MDSDALVCVGLTSYDREDGLRKCLISLLNQTYKNLEIRVCVDASPKQHKICEHIKDLTTDSRVKLILRKDRLGMHSNIKEAFSGVSAEYFFWADDDDWYESTFVEEGIKALENNSWASAWFPTMDNMTKLGFCYQDYPSFERHTSSDDTEKDLERFINEPEIRGKCNMMYSIFCVPALRETVQAYFLNDSWGTDNSLMIAFLTRFKIVCSKEVLFHKANWLIGDHRGYSSAEDLGKCTLGFPKNVANEYAKEHIAASSDKYKKLVEDLIRSRIERIFT